MTYTNEEKETMFWAFLKKRKAVGKFKKALKDTNAKYSLRTLKEEIPIHTDQIIMNCITWNMTEEARAILGSNYWADMDRKWKKFCVDSGIVIDVCGYNATIDFKEEIVKIGCYDVSFKKIEQVFNAIKS